MKRIIITVLLCIGQSAALFAASPQDSTITLGSNSPMDTIDFRNIHLPPVSVFLEAAKNYADVKVYDAKVKEEELMLKISRNEWLKYFRLQGSYQYGSTNAYLLQDADSSYPNPVINSRSTNTQSWYNVGVMVAVPLDDIFNRKKKNEVSRTRIQQSEYEKTRVLEERQIRILETYNEIIKNMALLKVKAESMALYNAQMQISERDFVNGQIDVITLSLERARRTQAMITYQESRASLHNAVTILEMLTNIKIIQD